MNSFDPKLQESAFSALEFSHSPYSNRRIGAALKLSNGNIYSGTNIENASYGGTVCAERVAIFKAYSENKLPVKISEIFVASEGNKPWPPCGFCRQVIAEFASEDTLITIGNPQGKTKSFMFKDLLPEAFSPKNFND
jgi:cytidine deaminase